MVSSLPTCASKDSPNNAAEPNSKFPERSVLMLHVDFYWREVVLEEYTGSAMTARAVVQHSILGNILWLSTLHLMLNINNKINKSVEYFIRYLVHKLEGGCIPGQKSVQRGEFTVDISDGWYRTAGVDRLRLCFFLNNTFLTRTSSAGKK